MTQIGPVYAPKPLEGWARQSVWMRLRAIVAPRPEPPAAAPIPAAAAEVAWRFCFHRRAEGKGQSPPAADRRGKGIAAGARNLKGSTSGVGAKGVPQMKEFQHVTAQQKDSA